MLFEHLGNVIVELIVSQLRPKWHISLWIGFNDRLDPNRWEWSDNSPVIYTNWNSAEPNLIDTVCLYSTFISLLVYMQSAFLWLLLINRNYVVGGSIY